MINIIDLKSVYQENQEEIDLAVQDVLKSGWYILGEQVKNFEHSFSKWVNVPHAVTVANGTDALELSLKACDIKKGDFVATVSHTAVATVSAIERCGAIPVFVDIDAKTMTLCPERLESILKKFNKPIRAVIPVHLYGQMVDMSSVMALSEQYGFYVIEDCAQAHGAKWKDKQAGTYGHAGAFSFYPTKNLGAFGDGGAVVTSSLEIANNLKLLRQYGWHERNNSVLSGVNSRLDEIQAAILSVLLLKLDDYTERRQQIAKQYDEVKNLNIQLPKVREEALHVYHQYVVRSKKRDKLQQYLEIHEIQSLVHYPKPVHLQPAYLNKYEIVENLTETEQCTNEILSIPIHPYLSDSQVDHIIKALSEWS